MHFYLREVPKEYDLYQLNIVPVHTFLMSFISSRGWMPYICIDRPYPILHFWLCTYFREHKEYFNYVL
jgi:hypothetical protein